MSKFEIALAERFVPAVLRREKITTIRMGQRDYVTGPYLFVSAGGAIEIPILITKIEYTRVECLLESDALRDGFCSLQELLECLRKFYPHIHFLDCVTIVHFELIEGKV